jgi:hypothetical protein
MVCSWTLSPATGASFNSPSQTTTNVLTTIPFLGTSVGSYSVVVTCDDDGAGPRTASATVTVVVVDPNAVVANVSGPATGTAGTAMTVQGVVSGGSNPAVITCTWSTVPAVPIAGNGCTSATFTPDRPGIFRVTVSATRGTGGNNNAVDYYDIVVEKANVPAVDTDRDGVADDQDNCPADANADQMDGDHNGRGDACDPQGVAPVSPVNPDGSPQAPSDVDTDLDGIADNQDNCPQVANANQDNLDHDEQGDACDPDDDGDQVVDTAANGLGDNCPRLYNPQQTDGDEDGTGDACDKSNGLGGSTGVSPGDAVATCPSCGDAATSSKELGSSRTGMLFVAGALAIAAVVVVAFALRRNR